MHQIHQKIMLMLALYLFSANMLATEPTKELASPASGFIIIKNGEVEKFSVKGHHSTQQKTPFTENSPFRIASNTKPYVAATLLRLVEEKMLSLNQSIDTVLPDDIVTMLKGAGYAPSDIQLKHLLRHTAGFRDHSTAKPYLQAIFANPAYRWHATQQIRMMTELGEPLFKPGANYQYSDTGYVLLGQIIEQTTRLTLSAAVRHYLDFAALGLHNTWWEFYETPPANSRRVHQYLSGTDTHDWHPTVDLFGGGGLVSTLKEMALFTDHLMRGKVFKHSDTLELMLSSTGHPAAEQSRYGILVTQIGDQQTLGHSGFWGTASYYVPELGITIAGVVSEQSDYKGMLETMAQLLSSLPAEKPSTQNN